MVPKPECWVAYAVGPPSIRVHPGCPSPAPPSSTGTGIPRILRRLAASGLPATHDTRPRKGAILKMHGRCASRRSARASISAMQLGRSTARQPGVDGHGEEQVDRAAGQAPRRGSQGRLTPQASQRQVFEREDDSLRLLEPHRTHGRRDTTPDSTLSSATATTLADVNGAAPRPKAQPTRVSGFEGDAQGTKAGAPAALGAAEALRRLSSGRLWRGSAVEDAVGCTAMIVRRRPAHNRWLCATARARRHMALKATIFKARLSAPPTWTTDLYADHADPGAPPSTDGAVLMRVLALRAERADRPRRLLSRFGREPVGHH